jgi:curli biogenesis system outer membrane secretion channel CsgG
MPTQISFTKANRSTLLGVTLVLCIASPSAMQAQKNGLEQCEEPIGTIAVVEPENLVVATLIRYNLPSPTSLIRMMIQKSNCFQVVERGVAMSNLLQERELARSGELQQQSNIGAGQLRAADFILTPNVIFSEGNSGGIIAGMASGAGLLGRVAAAGMNFKEAQTSMLIADARTGLQVASAEGKSRKSDFGIAAIAGLGGIGAYSNTNEGKVIAASFLNNYNKIVAIMWDDTTLIRKSKDGAPAAGSVQANAFAEGDVLYPKIDNVKILASPASSSAAVTTVNKSDGVVYLGEEKDGYVKIESSRGEGWIRKTLVTKR